MDEDLDAFLLNAKDDIEAVMSDAELRYSQHRVGPSGPSPFTSPIRSQQQAPISSQQSQTVAYRPQYSKFSPAELVPLLAYGKRLKFGYVMLFLFIDLT